jgi:two-component system, OmpR family, sensor histidine kinase KdpD
MSEDARPAPEEFLALANQEADKDKGRMRLYLGMCPGVGKTYAMLEDARRARQENVEVLVGLVETHGRAETQALLDGLPLLPRRIVAHRGAQLEEFDLDEALKRRPGLLLVDELAHENAPGSRHPKRWQDVEELLDAGIDIWTTLNIQHVESLRDAVMGITGIRVQETIPDTFLERAAEIRVMDLPPGQLLERLQSGKVYRGETAVAAGENFFREGNLKALREMALRFAARKVETEKRDYMRHHLIPGPWRAGERFLVAVGGSPHSERLIRIACRLAQAHDVGWIAAHVHSNRNLDEEAARRLANNLTLARSLGGEVISLSSDDPVEGILRLARRENVTQIIAGKSLEDSWWLRLRGTRIADRLHKESGDIDILLVHPGDAPHSRHLPKKQFVPSGPWVKEVAVAVGCLLAITLLGLLLKDWMGHQSVAFFYLLGVAILGLYLSRAVVIGMALAGGAAWNFFFTEPQFTFSMFNREDLILLLTSLSVAVIVGNLTAQLKKRETTSSRSEERAQALYRLTRVISASGTLAQAVQAALTQVENSFFCKASLLGRSADNGLKLIGGRPVTDKEESVCFWTLNRGQAAGRFTHTLPEAPILALPLAVNGKTEAVLAVWPGNDQLSSPEQRDLLETFAAHFCVLLEREQYQQTQREALLLEQTRKSQRALLDHVSHEIKTPVAVIQGATDHLLKQDVESGASKKQLLEEIRQAAGRLNRVFNQLVTLSRAEAGLIEPSLEVCDVHDLMQEIVSDHKNATVHLIGGDFTFRTDPTLLHTVLANLIQNAIQHGRTPVELEACQHRATILFRVSNTGPGIAEGDQEKIFERFQRGRSSSAGGMGLGLPIARQFAALIGGKLTLESSDPQKTVFALEFVRHD